MVFSGLFNHRNKPSSLCRSQLELAVLHDMKLDLTEVPLASREPLTRDAARLRRTNLLEKLEAAGWPNVRQIQAQEEMGIEKIWKESEEATKAGNPAFAPTA